MNARRPPPEALTFCRGYLCRSACKTKHVLCPLCWKRTTGEQRARWARCTRWLKAHPDADGVRVALDCATNDAIAQTKAWACEPENLKVPGR